MDEGSIDVEETFSSPTVDTIAFEVDYMNGQEPEVGLALDGNPVWNFFENNVSALFNATKTIETPKTLSQMEEIPAQNQNYSSSDILAISDQHRGTNLTSNKLGIYIVYVDGYFLINGEENRNVLGVSIGNTGVVAIFKPVIDANTFGTSNTKAFTEQTVLIHEAGHALGLVNNGLPLQSDHHDQEHGAHCTNKDCVMYWANEGLSDLIEFTLSKGTSTQSIVFESECLFDAHAQL